MRSEPTIDELIISIKNFLESLNIEIFPNIKKNIKILNEINEIDELKKRVSKLEKVISNLTRAFD